MAELKKLRKCPFCGGEAKIVEDNTIVEISQYQIRCKNVTCTIRPKTNWHVDKQEAIEHWNNRATEAEIRASVIDEFAEKLKWEYENSIGISQREIDFANAVTDQVAEQLKEET